jgi:adenosylcobyric acid synthase
MKREDEMALQGSRCLAVFGTASSVGKSTIAAGLGRALRNAGIDVAPFKAQNMSNNSYVAGAGERGGEIGRAQYVQALACKVEPSVHHNPVLLKPESDDGSQVVLHGQVVGRTLAAEYFRSNEVLRRAAFESLAKLRAQHEYVVIEGAGSCAEVNLRAREYVNFPVAHEANARVVLVADIDKGGVFAQVVGTVDLMLPEDRARVCGVIINKFRGDRSLFDDGVRFLEQRTAVPVLGVVSHDYALDIDSEDALPLAAAVDPAPGSDAECLRIAVVRLPHISNFTDVDALSRIEQVAVHFITRPRDLSSYSAVILPGSKNTLFDLGWMREHGLAQNVLDYHRGGGRILGICGGFQMLLGELDNSDGHDGKHDAVGGRATGLGLLRGRVTFDEHKVVRRVHGHLLREGQGVAGYEIHLGRVELEGHEPLLQLASPVDAGEGARDDEGRVWGTSIHGLFDQCGFRDAFLKWCKPDFGGSTDVADRRVWLNSQLDEWAAQLTHELDWSTILSWARAGR